MEYAEDTQQQGEDGAKSLAPVSVYCLSQEYAPLEYGSLEEAAREWQLSTPALEDMYRQVYEQLSYYTDSIYAYQYDQTALAQEYTNFRWYAACEDRDSLHQYAAGRRRGGGQGAASGGRGGVPGGGHRASGLRGRGRKLRRQCGGPM